MMSLYIVFIRKDLYVNKFSMYEKIKNTLASFLYFSNKLERYVNGLTLKY
jgi:hypothetical protein